MYKIVLLDCMGKSYFQENVNVNDIDRYMLSKYNASLFSHNGNQICYIPEESSQERLWVTVGMTA